jgi:hypothetical protein
LERSLHASSGLNLLGVSGHREGCSTECPGEQLYTELSEWRNLLRADMDACSEEEDSLQLSAMSSTFPYRVQLQWEGGPVNADRYLLQIRERDTGLARQKEFSGGVKQYGVDVQAGTTYEFQLLAYASPQSDFVRSNTVEWEVEEWHPDQESLFVSPNPVGKRLLISYLLILTPEMWRCIGWAWMLAFNNSHHSESKIQPLALRSTDRPGLPVCIPCCLDMEIKRKRCVWYCYSLTHQLLSSLLLRSISIERYTLLNFGR